MWYSIIGGTVTFFVFAFFICHRLWWRGFIKGYECGWRDGKHGHGKSQAEALNMARPADSGGGASNAA